MKSIETNKKVLEMASNLQAFIRENNWVTRYDAESDSFSMTKSKLSKDARIRYFDDEMAFYVTPDNNIEGIFVEYFGSNFVEHHKDLKTVLKNPNKKEANKSMIVELNKTKVSKIIPNLEEVLRSAIAQKMDVKLNPAS